MRFFLILIILLIFAAIPSTAALPEDSVLDKPVTLAAKGEALSDVILLLQKKTGAWLRVSRDLADKNVTILVDEKPLRDIMGGVSKLFGYAWRESKLNDHPVYELYETAAAKKEREAKLKQASDAAWAALLADIKHSYELTGMTKDEIDKHLKSDPENEIMADDEFRRILVESLKIPSNRALFGFASCLPDTVLNALRSGAEVYYDSASPEDEWSLPEDLTSTLIAEYIKTDVFTELEEISEEKNTDSTDLDSEDIEEYDTDSADVELGDILDADIDSADYGLDDTDEEYPDIEMDPEQIEDEGLMFHTPNHMNKQPDQINFKLYVIDCLNQLILQYSADFYTGEWTHLHRGSSILAVESNKFRDINGPTLPNQPDEKLMEKKVNWTKAELLKEADMPEHISYGDTGGEVNRSDVLAVLHRKLGIQVIADHYMDWRYVPEGKDLTLRQVLDDLKKEHGPMDFGRSDYKSTWGADSEFVYFRINDPISADPWEVPNRLLRPWQEKYARNHRLDLNDYAKMALLSPEQRDMITSYCERLRLGKADTFGWNSYLSKSPSALIDLPVIRLYGLLSQKQRKEAANRGTAVAAFTDDQRAALNDAIACQRSKRNSLYSTKRIGIYKEGIRIDKPEPNPQESPQPVLFEFGLSKSYGYYNREVVSKSMLDGEEYENTSSVAIKASSFEQAWEKIKDKVPVTDKRRLYYHRTELFRSKITFTDDTTIGIWPEINSRLTFEDYEADKKRKQEQQ